MKLKVERVDAHLMTEANFDSEEGGSFHIADVKSAIGGRKGSDNAVLDVQVKSNS